MKLYYYLLFSQLGSILFELNKTKKKKKNHEYAMIRRMEENVSRWIKLSRSGKIIAAER